jgi:hypothetical protein
VSEARPFSASMLDLAKAWVPVAAMIAGGLWAVYTYTDGQQQQAAAREANAVRETRAAFVQARQPFLERKMALFFETSRLAADLSHTEAGTPGWKAAEDRFWTLYWGEMSIVEKNPVEKCMMAFGETLTDYKIARDPLSKGLLKNALENVSYRLAHAMRYELLEDWADPSLGSQPRPKECQLKRPALAPRS